MPLRFPDGFLWGTASAAHQVEGQNTNNQWWDWEQQPGHIWHDDKSGDACGWWHHAEDDFDRAAALGQNAHRLSIEWSRIEPREGIFDVQALERYREMLLALHARQITPMITLHHFTNPRWLEARGGWMDPRTPECFRRFVAHAVAALGDLCDLWCTINEPTVYATQSYLLGSWPPGHTQIPETLRIMTQMLKGHALAAAAVRAAGKQVGLVHNLRIFEPASPKNEDVTIAALYDDLMNGAILRSLWTGRLRPPFGNGILRIPGLRGSCDFIGLNYYTRERIAFDPACAEMLFGHRFTPADVAQSDRGSNGETYGEIYPGGMYRALKRLGKLGLPIYITETGLPDADDDQRPDFILSHLAAVHRAIREGVDVRGVFLWTLVDNFEWSEGWGLRFGLYAMNEETGERSLRPSAGLYAAIARANAIPDPEAD